MKRLLYTIFGLLLLVSACNNQPQQPVNRLTLAVTTENDSLKLRRVLVPNDSGVVYLDLSAGYIEERIRKDSMQNIIVEFNPGDSTRLDARLSSTDSLANIRFSQIIMPDSTADGPFGTRLQYRLLQRGTYQLRIGENMMAGDPWAGLFLIKMELSN